MNVYGSRNYFCTFIEKQLYINILVGESMSFQCQMGQWVQYPMGINVNVVVVIQLRRKTEEMNSSFF